MSKNYNKLWMFGDSYSTVGVEIKPEDSFWGLTASYMNIPTIVNCSRPSNSFDSVCHLVVSMQEDIDWHNDFVLIGIPPLERITVFDNHKDTKYFGHTYDTHTWQSEKIDILSHRGLVSLQNFGADQHLILHSDRSWLETQTLRTLFFITTWLDSINANYLILNLSKNLDKNNIWGPSKFLLPYCLDHKRCIVFNNTYQSINLGVNKPADFNLYGWYGHHGPAGNQHFFEKSLKPKLIECELI